MPLTEEQVRLLRTLATLPDGERVDALAARLDIDQARVSAASVQLRDAGLVRIEEEPFRELAIRPDGRRSAREGFPERRVLRALIAGGGALSMADAAAKSGLEPKEVGGSLRWLTSRGWARKDGSTPARPRAGAGALRRRAAHRRTRSAREGARGRPSRRRSSRRRGNRTPEGAHQLVRGAREGPPPGRPRRGGQEDGLGGLESDDRGHAADARDARLGPVARGARQAYDVDLATDPRHPGKRHPLQRVIDETRRAFLDMGFEEWISPLVESAFWDFDALFQPQDHPGARDAGHVLSRGPRDVAAARRTPRWSTRVRARARGRRRHRLDRLAVPVGPGAGAAERPAHAQDRDHHPRPGRDPARPAQGLLRRPGLPARGDRLQAPAGLLPGGRDRHRRGGEPSRPCSGRWRRSSSSSASRSIEFRPDFFPYTEPSVEVFVWNEEKTDWFEMGGRRDLPARR